MKITIPGDPEEQARMRFFVRNGIPNVYDPKKKDKNAFKKYLLSFIQTNYPNYQFPKCPKLYFYFYCSIPKAMNKKLRYYAERGLLRKRTKPDSDNYLKLYMDCMNEIVYEDDAHASIGDADKFYDLNPRTVIYVDECDEILNIPPDELARFSESCEWIRATTASPRGLICRPYLENVQFPASTAPTATVAPSRTKSPTQLSFL